MTVHGAIFRGNLLTAEQRRDGKNAPPIDANAVEIQADRAGSDTGDGRSRDVPKDKRLWGFSLGRALDTASISFSGSFRKAQKTSKAFADGTRIKPRRLVRYG